MKLIYEEMTFAQWLDKNTEKIQTYVNIVSSKLDPQMDQSAQYIALSDNLCDIKQDVCELHNEAEQFYRDWLAKETEKQSEKKGFIGKSPKTILDFCKQINCVEGVVYRRLESILSTGDYVASQIQSKLKYYKPQ